MLGLYRFEPGTVDFKTSFLLLLCRLILLCKSSVPASQNTKARPINAVEGNNRCFRTKNRSTVWVKWRVS
jgi:hypothetical protein